MSNPNNSIVQPHQDQGWGVSILSGPEDWQIVQRDADDRATISWSGAWTPNPALGVMGGAGGRVQVRLVREDTGRPLGTDFDWRDAETKDDGNWNATVQGVPAGGLYRLETRLNPKDNKLGEWSIRGDTRHFLGVGDIWILAGQSNASGYGRSPYLEGPELGIHVLRADGHWALASHPLHDGTDSILRASLENYNNGHSPFLHFARILKGELRIPIGLLPTALGGSELSAWDPVHGRLFENLRVWLTCAGGKARGMVWYQGESDTESGKAESYLERFMSAAMGWRRNLGLPDLPILTVQLGRYLSAHPGNEDVYWSLVREAQRRAARELENVTVVPALDLGLDDAIHLSSAANLVLGERLAASALGSVYHKNWSYQSPEPLEAKLDSDHSVHIRFTHVASRLDTSDAGANPFRARDESGEIPIVKVVYYHRDCVRLVFGRSLQGNVWVSCGAGENPEDLPVDVERRLPILAFHDYEIPNQSSGA